TQIFHNYDIEHTVIDSGVRCEPQSSAVRRRVQHAGQQHLGSHCRTLIENLYRNVQRIEFSKRTQSSGKVTEPPSHLAIDGVGVTSRLGIQAYSSATGIQPFASIGSAHSNQVNVAGLTIQKSQCASRRVTGKTNGRSEVVATACGD